MSADVSTAPNDGATETTPDGRDHSPHHIVKRMLISLGVLGFMLAVVIGGGLWFLTNRYAGNIDRVANVFSGLDEKTRPEPAQPAQRASADPVTFLLVGSDTRAHPAPGETPDGRSDAIIVARFSGDRRHAQLIS